MIVADLVRAYADELEYLIQCLAMMSECNCSVMREAALDQYVTVETSHILDCEYTDAAEGLRCYRKYFALCYICTQDIVCGALQTVECDVARNDVTLEGSVCNLYRKASCHDLLVFHVVAYQLGCAGIAAVEAHEGILVCVIEFALDGLFVHICRYRVVDIEQRYCIVAYAGSDELT